MKTRTKSDETRARILEVAIELFQQRGFAATTMREIAAAAGMATGAAYYYFDSKDAIVLAFYELAAREMEPLLDAALAGKKSLEERVRAMLEVKLHYFEPNRALLGALAGHTDPRNPLSPFSAETRGIRERDMHFFSRALAESNVKTPPDLADVSAGHALDVPDGADSLLDPRPLRGSDADALAGGSERGRGDRAD